MRESDAWNAVGYEIESSTETHVRHSGFETWMSENFNLWEPFSNPEVWVFFRKFKSFETPNDFIVKSFKSIIEDLNRPFLPMTL